MAEIQLDEEGLLHPDESNDSQSVTLQTNSILVEDEVEKPTEDALPSQYQTVRYKRFQTGAYYANYISLGLVVGCIGPTLLVLAKNTNSTVEEAGLMFPSRAIFWMVGAIVSGRLYEKYQGHRLLVISLILMMLGLLLVPLLSNIYIIVLLQGLISFFGSWIDVGGNALIMSLWKPSEVGPYIQLLHFMFGVGATVAPFIAGIMIGAFPEDSRKSMLWAYWSLAALCILAAIPTVLLKSPPVQKKQEEISSKVHIPGIREKFKWLAMNYGIVFLVGLYLFLYVGGETAYGGWISTYAVTVYKMPEDQAAYLSSVFWGAITIGRLLAATKFTARTMLLADMAGCMVSLVVLLALDHLKSHTVLWITTFSVGLFMASIFATAFSLPGEFNITVNSRAASVMIVEASIGDMGLPVVAGWTMSWFEPQALFWTILVIYTLAILTYVGIVYGARYINKSKNESVEQEFELVQTAE